MGPEAHVNGPRLGRNVVLGKLTNRYRPACADYRYRQMEEGDELLMSWGLGQNLLHIGKQPCKQMAEKAYDHQGEHGKKQSRGFKQHWESFQKRSTFNLPPTKNTDQRIELRPGCPPRNKPQSIPLSQSKTKYLPSTYRQLGKGYIVALLTLWSPRLRSRKKRMARSVVTRTTQTPMNTRPRRLPRSRENISIRSIHGKSLFSKFDIRAWLQ